MGRVYGEPVEVQVREDGRPLTFTWRERRYAVAAVQEHWMVNRDWWREPAPVPARPELEFWRVEASAGQGSYPRGGRPPGPPGSLPGEEAESYRTATAGTYELRRDVAVGTWTLRWIAD